MRVLVLFGGASPEHEVSIRSAKTVSDGLSKKHDVYLCYITKNDEWKFTTSTDNLEDLSDVTFEKSKNRWVCEGKEFEIDLVFIIVHGVGGEDGTMQSTLDRWGVKYVGTPAKESSLCFDKVETKALLRNKAIPVVEEYVYLKSEEVPSFKKLHGVLGSAPYFVKPARSGSSVGVARVTTDTELKQAVADALQYDEKILIERGVSSPRELEVAILEKTPGEFEASIVGEIVADGGFYSYDSKYSTSSKTRTVINPSDLPNKIASDAPMLALKVSAILGCRGLVRVDFLYDSVRKTLYLNEVNTLPGFTAISMYPMLWEASGISLAEQLDIMVTVAMNDNL